MVALVKTCKTFRLSNRLAWKDIKTKVEGVKFLDERRAIMVFHKPAGKTMTLLGSDHIDVVKTCSVYDGADGDNGNGDDEAATLRAVIKASGMGTTYITALAHDFSVFRVNTDKCLDVFRLHLLLSRLGASVVMEHELHESLFITDDRVVWRISDTVPQKILASVAGVAVPEAEGLVNRSRRKMGLF
ncbi:unnamed protein product [Ectocarpus sp. 4 AP-2014]|uniref:EsV-1-53 n=1 Tax=Ectocarpus siliculosus virus 1 (isolate New Zealand/Kaikoura/1988) TaxID=654926 RepID=Q8QNL4_ESV1K|nr:EsV-1-53 [Ectocarpus siliculosus virus 1]AAK14479.1 EsV-1-53 [Ectocarpus siliculosus virus 1]